MSDNEICLIYTSQSTDAIGKDVLQDIVDTSRLSNSKADISGVLLLSGQCFLQLLEGPAEQVNSLYERIAKDPRHTKLEVIYNQPTSFRRFPCWTMGKLYLEMSKGDPSDHTDAFVRVLNDLPQGPLDQDIPISIIKSFVNIFGDEIDQAGFRNWMLTSQQGAA